ncbi:MAG: DUF429 domain-containing protein [Chloroflexia bacterium]|nr:DUF429 domain-containing protein [Chloroflexia bacterium]
MRVVGVDGCPGGWLAVAYDDAARTITPAVHLSFAELLAAYPDVERIGVDIPIGLAEGERRRADLEARKVLGPRQSSVFPAPDPRIVTAPTYAAASQRSRSMTGGGVSQQAFAIFPKVLEVNWCLTPAQQGRVFEVHPEVCFWALGGRPMAHAKATADGFEERRALLSEALGVAIPERRAAGALAKPAAADDVLDALVAAWSARRDALGQSGRLPKEPQIDGRGLRMEIVY